MRNAGRNPNVRIVSDFFESIIFWLTLIRHGYVVPPSPRRRLLVVEKLPGKFQKFRTVRAVFDDYFTGALMEQTGFRKPPLGFSGGAVTTVQEGNMIPQDPP